MRVTLGAKIITVVSLLYALSLALLVGVVSLTARSDIEQRERANNADVNRVVSASTWLTLATARADTLAFFRAIHTFAGDRIQNAASFFAHNPDIAVVYMRPPNSPAETLINEQFFTTHELKTDILPKYIESGTFRSLLSREAPALDNASATFGGVPLVAMTLQAPEAWSSAVIFSSQSLVELFGSGANASFMTNSKGDIVVHSDMSRLAVLTCITPADTANAIVTRNPIPDTHATVWTVIPYAIVHEGIAATTRRNIYFGLGVLGIAVLLAWYFALALKKPVLELDAAAREIEKGNYHISIHNKRQDETGLLSRSIISMSNVLTNFETFTNKEIARLATRGRLTTGGERKNATVFFSDIRSFTAISEQMSAAEVVKFLNAYMERMSACILASGGVIDKYIGDAIMAHWGAVGGRGSPEADAQAAVAAALACRAMLACYNRQRNIAGLAALKNGCSLDSGDLIAGQIGSEERLEFTVIGETVQMADHLEAYNKPYGTDCLISERTLRLLGGHYRCEEEPAVPRARKGAMRVFTVVNTADEKTTDYVLGLLAGLEGANMETIHKVIGPNGPNNIAELRLMLGIPEPDLAHVEADTRKFRVVDAGDGNAIGANDGGAV
jgi:adenylate cyclase